MHFSASPLEKPDPQILYASGRDVPTTGTRSMEVRDKLRLQADAWQQIIYYQFNYLLIILLKH